MKELETYKLLKEEEARIEVTIKNLEDELTDADQQLDIENGALMTHIRHDKPFRCVALCAANAAGNEVIYMTGNKIQICTCARILLY